MFIYFGYGSNTNTISLKAKGVNPISSEHGVLQQWRLKFNVKHWFAHEGGVGNIEPGGKNDFVEGVLHQCNDEDLEKLDAMEAYGEGYDRTEVEIHTKSGIVKAIAYIGLPNVIDNRCLPSRRYLNIIIKGAQSAGFSKSYFEKLKKHPIHTFPEYPEFRYPASTKTYDKKLLALNPGLTALAGAVFDMNNARKDLKSAVKLFAGKDMTLFHLKRLDSSTGNETLDDIKTGNISPEGKIYINAYLHEYNKEFTYVGRYVYDNAKDKSLSIFFKVK